MFVLNVAAVAVVGQKICVTQEYDFEDLIRDAGSRNGSVRLRSIKLLGESGDERAIPVLESSLYYNHRSGSDKDVDATRLAAAIALGKIPSERAADALLGSLNKAGPVIGCNREICNAIASSLAQIGGNDLFNRLVTIANGYTTSHAVFVLAPAIAKFEREDALPALATLAAKFVDYEGTRKIIYDSIAELANVLYLNRKT